MPEVRRIYTRDELGPRQRQVVELRDDERRSNVEAAHIMGINPNRSSEYYTKAKARLGEEVAHQVTLTKRHKELDLRTFMMRQKRAATDADAADRLGRIRDGILHRLETDHEAIAGATLRELGSLLSTVIEKRQLLQGAPTAIMGVKELKDMDDAAEKLMAEMKRRGLGAKDITAASKELSGKVIENE